MWRRSSDLTNEQCWVESCPSLDTMALRISESLTFLTRISSILRHLSRVSRDHRGSEVAVVAVDTLKGSGNCGEAGYRGRRAGCPAVPHKAESCRLWRCLLWSYYGHYQVSQVPVFLSENLHGISHNTLQSNYPPECHSLRYTGNI